MRSLIMFHFGPASITPDLVFCESEHCIVFPDLNPQMAGHVLAIPKRSVQYLHLLTPEERADLFATARRVGDKLREYYHRQDCSFLVQDGKCAGQTMPHVHCHVFPRNHPTEWKPERNVPYEKMCELAQQYRALFE